MSRTFKIALLFEINLEEKMIICSSQRLLWLRDGVHLHVRAQLRSAHVPGHAHSHAPTKSRIYDSGSGGRLDF